MTDPAHRWIVDNKNKLKFFISFVKKQYEDGKHVMYSIKDTTRSDRQNNAMHLVVQADSHRAKRCWLLGTAPLQ